MSPEDLNIRDLLARLYRREQDRFRLLDEAGIDTARIPLGDSSLNDFHEIIRYATNRGQLAILLRAAQMEHPQNAELTTALAGQLTAARGPEMVHPPRPDFGILEKITQEASTLLPLHFLAQGLEASRAVARIAGPDGRPRGTGFMIQEDWLLTNHHVLGSAEAAAEARVQFAYEESAGSAAISPVEMLPSPVGSYFASPEHDWAVVKMPSMAAEQFGYLRLAAREMGVGGFVNIIQHPGGAPKRVALYHNVVIEVLGALPCMLHYLTDTQGGSSGSPVFDSDWNVVALHHAGFICAQEDGALLTYNEGIRIGTVLADLRARGAVTT